AGRKNFAVEPDVRSVGELDVAVFARENCVAADEDTVADGDAAVRFAFCVEEAVVVDHDVVAEANLVRMSQHDVLTEDDVAPARAEEPRVQHLAQGEPERARNSLRGEHDELMLDKRAQSRPADNELGVLRAARFARREQLFLSFCNRRSQRTRPAGVRASHVHGTSQGCAQSLRAIRRAENTQSPAAPARCRTRGSSCRSQRAADISAARYRMERTPPHTRRRPPKTAIPEDAGAAGRRRQWRQSWRPGRSGWSPLRPREYRSDSPRRH